MSQCPQSRIALIWDGASYHRSVEVKDHLTALNSGLEPSTGGLYVFVLPPMTQSRTPMTMFGYKQNGLFESVTIRAEPLVRLDVYLSL